MCLALSALRLAACCFRTVNSSTFPLIRKQLALSQADRMNDDELLDGAFSCGSSFFAFPRVVSVCVFMRVFRVCFTSWVRMQADCQSGHYGMLGEWDGRCLSCPPGEESGPQVVGVCDVKRACRVARPVRPAQKAPIALRAVLSHRYTDTLSQNGWVWHSPVLDDTHAGCSG